jgi:protease II
MVVSLCVRGGGENGDKWWDASRTAKRRHVGVSDFVKGVEFIQSKFGFNNTNIRSVNIHAVGSEFKGIVTVFVKNTDHLHRLFEKVRKVNGITTIDRYEG